jgi:hypothetical protein
MGYKSFKNKVESELEQAIKDASNEIGLYIVAESQLRTPVLSATLRRGETFDLIENGVRVGSNVPYDVYVEFNNDGKNAHWQPAVYDNLSEIKDIVEKHLKNKLGGV